MTRSAAEQVAELLGVDRVIIVFPQGEKTAIDWIGMSAEQVVRTFYSCGDTVLKRVPLPALKPPPR